MIAIDTSAIVAMMLGEQEADAFAATIQGQARVLIGMPTLLEARMVGATKFNPLVQSKMARLITSSPFVQITFDAEHLDAAASAFERFGKGRHPASLNFGDCMAYAVAAVAGCPLLFKGNDFARTDIDRVT